MPTAQFWRYAAPIGRRSPITNCACRSTTYDGADFETPAGEPSNVKLTKTRVNSVLNECAALCAEPGFFDTPPAGINCASGFIRFDADGTPRLEPHHRDHRCRHTLPGHWQPGASGTPPDGLAARAAAVRQSSRATRRPRRSARCWPRSAARPRSATPPG